MVDDVAIHSISVKGGVTVTSMVPKPHQRANLVWWPCWFLTCIGLEPRHMELCFGQLSLQCFGMHWLLTQMNVRLTSHEDRQKTEWWKCVILLMVHNDGFNNIRMQDIIQNDGHLTDTEQNRVMTDGHIVVGVWSMGPLEMIWMVLTRCVILWERRICCRSKAIYYQCCNKIGCASAALGF